MDILRTWRSCLIRGTVLQSERTMLVYRALSSAALFLGSIIAAHHGAFLMAVILPNLAIAFALGPNRRAKGKLARARWATIRKRGAIRFVVERSVGASALMILYYLCLRYALQPSVLVLKDNLLESKWQFIGVSVVIIAFCIWDWRIREKEFLKKNWDVRDL